MAHQHPFPWKAAAPSLALSAVLLAVTVCANSMLLVSNRESDGSITQAMDGLNTVVELELSVAEMRLRLSDYISSGDGARLAEAMLCVTQSSCD